MAIPRIGRISCGILCWMLMIMPLANDLIEKVVT